MRERLGRAFQDFWNYTRLMRDDADDSTHEMEGMNEYLT